MPESGCFRRTFLSTAGVQQLPLVASKMLQHPPQGSQRLAASSTRELMPGLRRGREWLCSVILIVVLMDIDWEFILTVCRPCEHAFVKPQQANMAMLLPGQASHYIRRPSKASPGFDWNYAAGLLRVCSACWLCLCELLGCSHGDHVLLECHALEDLSAKFATFITPCLSVVAITAGPIGAKDQPSVKGRGLGYVHAAK